MSLYTIIENNQINLDSGNVKLPLLDLFTVKYPDQRYTRMVVGKYSKRSKRVALCLSSSLHSYKTLTF